MGCFNDNSLITTIKEKQDHDYKIVGEFGLLSHIFLVDPPSYIILRTVRSKEGVVFTVYTLMLYYTPTEKLRVVFHIWLGFSTTVQCQGKPSLLCAAYHKYMHPTTGQSAFRTDRLYCLVLL